MTSAAACNAQVSLALGNGAAYSNDDLEERLKSAQAPKDLETVDVD